jgi:hypothetical protein
VWGACAKHTCFTIKSLWHVDKRRFARHKINRLQGRPGELFGTIQGVLLRGRLREPPRWIPAILTRVVKAQNVAVGIPQISFSPKPGLIRRRGIKRNPTRRESGAGGIDVRALEVDNYVSSSSDCADMVHREGCATRTLEASVFRGITDNLREAQCSIERGRPLHIRRWQRHLIQIHFLRLHIYAVAQSLYPESTWRTS